MKAWRSQNLTLPGGTGGGERRALQTEDKLPEDWAKPGCAAAPASLWRFPSGNARP